MDLRTLLLGGGHRWDGNPTAADPDLAELAAWSPAPLPPEYWELLRYCDGGQASRSEYPTYVRIWSSRTVVNYNSDYQVQQWLPGLIGFGDDGGPTLVGFDTRAGRPYPVVAVPFAPMEWDSAVEVAPDFRTFIGRLVLRGSSA